MEYLPVPFDVEGLRAKVAMLLEPSRPMGANVTATADGFHESTSTRMPGCYGIGVPPAKNTVIRVVTASGESSEKNVTASGLYELDFRF